MYIDGYEHYCLSIVLSSVPGFALQIDAFCEGTDFRQAQNVSLGGEQGTEQLIEQIIEQV